MTYEQIAELLRQKYNLSIQAAGHLQVHQGEVPRPQNVWLWQRRYRKKASFCSPPASRKGVARRAEVAETPAQSEQYEVEFQFTPSDRYNLTRLPPEVAAAIRKKLEEEGH